MADGGLEGGFELFNFSLILFDLVFVIFKFTSTLFVAIVLNLETTYCFGVVLDFNGIFAYRKIELFDLRFVGFGQFGDLFLIFLNLLFIPAYLERILFDYLGLALDFFL